MKERIYLDYNASAPPCPPAGAAMKAVLELSDGAYNASAIHGFGRDGRRIIEDARRNVAQLVGAEPNQVIFNSGATEGNNTVLRHFRETFPDDTILVSATEHPSVRSAIKDIEMIPVLPSGLIDLEALRTRLGELPRVSLVCVMLANNETGIIQNVADISKLCQTHGAFFQCDATQAAGRMPINMQESGIDFLTLSAHKIGGAQGVGALAMRVCGQTPVMLHGGGQEKSARAGTENVAGIAAFGAAALFARENMEDYTRLSALRDRMERALISLSPTLIIHGKDENRIPNTSFFSLPDTSAQTLLMALDLEGIAVSNGSACSSGTVKPSAVLTAMGYDEKAASSALRISTGWATKSSDIDTFLEAWAKIIARLGQKKG